MKRLKKLLLGGLILGTVMTFIGLNMNSTSIASDSAWKKSNPYGARGDALAKRRQITEQKGLAKHRLVGINYELQKFEPNTVEQLRRGEFGNLGYGSNKNVVVYFSEAPCQWGEQVISYIDSLSNDPTFTKNYTFYKRSLHADHTITTQEQVDAINDFMNKCHPPYCIINTKTHESLTIRGSAPYAAKTMRTVFGAARNW